ncbi:Ca(2+)-dependent cysteine protease [Entomophthora muscae]|uniref:Ca(2+)-dependent cysteine protease n=1 Tax=Entomophthora muscae TaxID=34485 RepID=A0ACC2REV9_9FUNG|nr:Ca(2+)-dependent cysteine protease [Entomophthora muscae]
MTFALTQALALNPYSLSYLQLLQEMRTVLKPKYTQVPQLSSNIPLDMEAKFAI